MKVIEVAISSIEGASFNPPNRTTDIALRGLREDILQRGMLAPIHLVPVPRNLFVIADGHRRFTIAEERGESHIASVIHPAGTDVEQLWATLNSKTRSLKSFDWMVAWYSSWKAAPRRERPLSGALAAGMPPTTRAAIESAIAIFGIDGIQFLIDQECSPAVSSVVYRLWARLDETSKRRVTSGIAMKVKASHGLNRRQVGHWMVRHKLQGKVSGILNAPSCQSATLRKIQARISADESFEILDVVPTSKAGE